MKQFQWKRERRRRRRDNAFAAAAAAAANLGSIGRENAGLFYGGKSKDIPCFNLTALFGRDLFHFLP